jgi:predicted transposase/invertase (TIGR01784 family)
MDKLLEKASATWEYDLDSARYEGEEKGRLEGEASGLIKGRLEGRREGEESGLIKTARNALIKGFPVTVISEITGLDVDTVQGLARTL